jgi:hypothetical protein
MTGWVFEPPVDWKYAQGRETTVATSKSAVVIIATRSVEAAHTAESEALLRSVAGEIKVVLPKRKRLFPKKPDKIEDVAPLHVSLYQLDGATREGTKGPLLIFTTQLPNGPQLLGAAFVADDDADNSDQAVLKAIDSIAASPSAPPPAASTP